MKLVLNKDVVLQGLQSVQSIVATRSTLPVLYNVYLKAEKDRLWLTATDLEVTVRSSLEAKIQRQGGVTLPARRLFSIFKELPANEIEIDVDDKDVASIRAGSSFFKIIGISEEEFPPLPKFSASRRYTLPQATLKAMLAATHYCVSHDESRFILTGVLFSFKDGKLTVVATDGRRMALWEQEVDVAKEMEGDWIVPSKTVGELMKSLNAEGDVSIGVADNQISFEFGPILIFSKLIEGTYPNFRQVIPKQSEERVTIERELFQSSVHRAALLVGDKSNSISLRFAKDQVEVSASAMDVGEAKEAIPVKYRGKDVTISFNPDFLLDVLRNVSGDEVQLEISDELSPAQIRSDKPFLCVIMPMRTK